MTQQDSTRHDSSWLNLRLRSLLILIYSFQDVKYIDDGDYLCNATNRFGHVHARGKLIVKEQTRITQVRDDFKQGVLKNPALLSSEAIDFRDLLSAFLLINRKLIT